jgi:hypothetical protein
MKRQRARSCFLSSWRRSALFALTRAPALMILAKNLVEALEV